MRCEVLIDHVSEKAQRILRAMVAAESVECIVTGHYVGKSDTLMLWGARRVDHLRAWHQHQAAGGVCVGFDLGYWDRPMSVRLHIDNQHPSTHQLAASPAVGRREFMLRDDADPAGPVVLCGIGRKSAAALQQAPGAWERGVIGSVIAANPGKVIEWRAKPNRLGPQALPDKRLRRAPDGPIEQALRGRSLVVCSHSNVAVDACIAGVPVECADGAAFALYKDNPRPTQAQRLDFLNRLSWWNWDAEEAKEIWTFIRMICASTSVAAAA